jgi:short-subunit dehydrogenase
VSGPRVAYHRRVLLRGAVALVTGASSGLGTSCAQMLTARGARVLAHGRDEGALRKLAERTGAVPLVADLSAPRAGRDLAARAIAEAGRAFGTEQVDLLVANAGVGFAGPLSTMDEERPAALLAANLTAPIELTRALLPAMLDRRWGALVYVGSIAGRMGVAGEAVYAASKAGLDSFATSLRLELRGTGVQVGLLVPGVIATRFFERRGRPYGRIRPRPLAADVVAAALVRLIETGAAETYRPRWLGLPVAIRFSAPGLYRRLAGRFGDS